MNPDSSNRSSVDHIQSSRLSEDLVRLLKELQLTPGFFDYLRSFRQFQDILDDLDVSDEDQLDLFEILGVDGGGWMEWPSYLAGSGELRCGRCRLPDFRPRVL